MTNTDEGRPRTRTAVSLLILGVLTMQTLAGFKVLCPPRTFESLRAFRIACSPTLWPFLDYNMYNGARYPGWTGASRSVIATLDDGSERMIEPDDLDMTAHEYRIYITEMIFQERAPAARSYLTAWDVPTERVVSLRVDVETWHLEDDGTFTRRPIERGSPLMLPAERAR